MLKDDSKYANNNGIFPHPLRKQLARGDACSPLPLEAVHLHVRSTADAGASRMLAVRDRLRCDCVATEQYNNLKVAAARGELSQHYFEYSRNAFFVAAEGDYEDTATTGSNSNGTFVLDDKLREQVQQEGSPFG